MAAMMSILPHHNRAEGKNAYRPLKLGVLQVSQKRILLARALRKHLADPTEVMNDAGGATRKQSSP